MSQSPTSLPAGSPPAVAPALLERHEAGLRLYLAGLPGAEPLRVDTVVRELMREAASVQKVEDDPAVWLFTQGRRRIVTGGHRGDVLVADDGEGGQDEETVAGEDPGIAVHRAFSRLTIKQQEALRLKFQFGFNLAELADITGVSHSGAAGLLHSGMVRLCQASGATLSLGEGVSPTVRLTAYALDEMIPAEKTAFAESVPDGKALLESSDAIRKTGARLARILASGAPLPKRRRRRQGGSWWKTPRVLVVGVVMAAVAALAWYLWGRSEAVAPKPEDARSGMNGSYAIPTRARRGDANEPGRRGDRADGAFSSARDGGMPRMGASERNRKGVDATEENSGDGTNPNSDSEAAAAEGEVGPAATQGGSRSRGAASGEVSGGDPAAENRGTSGSVESSGSPESGADVAMQETASPDEASPESARPSVSTPTAAATAHQMRPAKPEAKNSAASTPGSAQEGSPAEPAPVPGVGVSALRRELAQKHWPGPGSVSTSDWVRQAPPEAKASENATDEPLAVRVDIARSPWAPERFLVRVALKARQAPVPARPPANLVFAIDVSQSMAGPNRLPLVQEGIRLLAERLRPEDRVAVVTYAATAKELLPGVALGEKALELRNCLGGLEAAGQTNGYEGLTLAYAAARRNRAAGGVNVVVLCTDGNFNLGETNEAALAGLAARAAADGIQLSVFGFGRSDRNDLRLELLATKGGGRSCYVNTREEAERLLATQIDGLLEPAARDVTLAVKFSAGQVAASERIDGGVQGGDSVAVAELLPGRSAGALYEISLQPGGKRTARLGELDLGYRAPGLPTVQHRTVPLDGTEQEWGATDRSFRFAVAWAEFGRILHGERGQAGADLARLEAWVRRVLPDDTGGYRSELLDNLAAAQRAATEGR